MFKPVDSKVNIPAMEEAILQFWKDRDIFRKSVESRAGGPQFKTMKGYQAPRKGGWDTHGLPVELEIERELGISSKPEIEDYGIDLFNARCRESVMRYVKEWESLTDRIAFWVDMDNAYVTFTNEYIESCWWIMKQLWDAGLVYRHYRVTPHCPRCGTSLSSHEVALGYKDDTPDPSVYVKFRVDKEATLTTDGPLPRALQGDVPTFLLAWTTTPWTLPGNTALAIAPDAEYAVVEVGESEEEKARLILASALVDRAVLGEHSTVAFVRGQDLLSLKYEPLYSPDRVNSSVLRFVPGDDGRRGELQYAPTRQGETKWSYPVIPGDFVSMEDGTGIVHIAPAYGDVDFQAGEEHGLFFIQTVDLSGNMTILLGKPNAEDDIGGRFVKDADPRIKQDLQERGLLYRSETITHTYPFCWRCDTPLLYYAKTSWYIRTTAVKDELINGNLEINWYPEHIKQGRFGDWLENNIDWAISRERYWGTPLNVWRCESCDGTQCVGGLDELR
ncbi:MAG: isoleucyl-tRNA synthetase, partial [Dehalococcoidia bacterium]|nr:isoleucyl-tRNA synthetase [Dehalococcoidia bacterium]